MTGAGGLSSWAGAGAVAGTGADTGTGAGAGDVAFGALYLGNASQHVVLK